MNNNINKESWNKIVIKNHGSPLHSWEWIKSIENDGLKVKWFYLNNKNGYVAVPIIEKYKVFGWIPFGIPFSGDLQFVKNNFKKFILKSKLIGIITNNYKTFNGSKLPSSLFHFFLKKKTETITLDFTNKTNEELFNGFNSTTRKHIKRALKTNIECVDFEDNDYSYFFSKYLSFMKNKKLNIPITLNRLLYLTKHVKNDKFGLNIVLKKGLINGKRVGFLMTLFIGNRALEFIRYDEINFKKIYGSKLLTWEMLKCLNDKNINLYDFGGVNKNNLPGIYQYKIGFGGDYLISNGFQFCLPL